MVRREAMFDSHIHTRFSTDSGMDISDAIDKAKKLNIGLVLTEHMDTDYPIPGKFVFDPKKYFLEYSKYRGEKLLLGMELGLRNDALEKNRSLAENYPFDFVLGSVHVVDKVDLFGSEFYESKTKKEAYEHYLRANYECLKEHNFVDSLGHIDYITRYTRKYEDAEIYYEEFSDYIDEVLKLVIERGIAIEINTRRFDNKHAVKNLEKIYNRYHDLGGKIVTIGSDAHGPEGIGRYLKEAYDMAGRCGLKTVIYKERKPEYVK